MRRFTIAGLVLLVVTAWASAADMEAQEANRDIMICYYKATLQFDDGHSDVSSLTPIVADWCQKESDRFSRIIRSRIDGPVDEQKVRQFSREKDLQMASRIILLKRANDRKAAQK